MSTLLEDVEELLTKNYGDRGRLLHIKETLEKNKILYVSDRQFLTNLCKKHLDHKSSEHKNQQRIKYSEKSDDMLYSENENMFESNESVSDISTESENKIFCTNCGNEILESSQFCTNCRTSPNAISHTNCSNYQQYSQSTQSAGGIWYLLPIFFGLLGGIIAWALIRNRNSDRARNCLILGTIVTSVPIIAVYLGTLLSPNILFSGTSEIDDALSGFPERIQNIKREQILNCENSMGYLQSHELGEMIKERCINGILGK